MLAFLRSPRTPVTAQCEFSQQPFQIIPLTITEIYNKYMEFLFETMLSCHRRASRMSGGKYMACSDTSNTLYNTTLGKSCTTLLQKLMGARVTSWVVFRRLLAIQRSDFDGEHKSNTTSQGASASVNERSMKNRFG